MSTNSMRLLNNIVDVYLSDFKYGNDKCAEKLSKVKNYIRIVKRNHLLAFRDSEMIIRHLVLPNHFKCCTKPILNFIKKNFKDKVVVNLMGQYRPEYRAMGIKGIDRSLNKKEFRMAVNYSEKLKLNFIN
jgi:putative pyruvate formate lyase activating enzyme